MTGGHAVRHGHAFLERVKRRGADVAIDDAQRAHGELEGVAVAAGLAMRNRRRSRDGLGGCGILLGLRSVAHRMVTLMGRHRAPDDSMHLPRFRAVSAGETKRPHGSVSRSHGWA